MKLVRMVVSLFVVFATSALVAQTAGSIAGVVSDPSGALVQGAKVTAANEATGAVRDAETNTSGYYSLTNLVPGTYTVKVEKQGFQTVNFEHTPLTVAQALVLNAKFVVGAVQESIEVNAANVAPIETESTQLSTLIDNRTIVDLPLLTRNPYELVLLSPGAIQTNDGSNGFSVNGSRDRNNNFLLDGVDNNDTSVPGGASGVVAINPDSAEEFRVITNTFNAEYGRNTGAIIDVVTRSGTNGLHGDAYWFGRYTALGARGFFNRAPDPQDPYVRNQFGFSVGGPIIKNRTFFFVNNEYQRFRTTLTNASTVPTSAFKSGLFTTPDGQQIDVRTPNSPGNLTGLGLDPVVAKELALLPEPNGGNVIPGITGTLLFPSPDNVNNYTWTAKIDHRITDKHQLTLRYAYNHGNDSNPFHTDYAPGIDIVGSPSYSHGVLAGLTSTFSSRVINDFKFGWNKVFAGFNSNCGTVYDPITGTDAVGNGRDLLAPDASLGLGPLSAMGCNGLFSSTGQQRHTGTTSYSDAVTWVKGNHTFKFGGDYRDVRSAGDVNFNSRDELGFNFFSGFGVPSVNINQGSLGNSFVTIQDLAWMLLGGSFTQFQAQFFNKAATRQQTDNKNFRQHEADGFVQDSWKVRPYLTLNVGLRYQFNGVPYEEGGNFSNLFVNPDSSLSSYTLTLVGPGGQRGMYNNDLTNFEPRIGFAWDPYHDGKTSIRGGYGIFHDRIFDNLFGNARSNPPFQQTVSNLFLNPLSAATLPFGTTTPGSVTFVNGDNAVLTLLDPNIKMPTSQNWDFGIQRELTGNFVLELDYVGSHATRVIHTLDAVPPDPALTQQAIALCAAQMVPVDQGGCLPGDPTGVISNAELYTGIADFGPNHVNIAPSVRNTAIQTPGFFPPTNITRTNADGTYNALQLKLAHRLSHGLQLSTAYTWSHSIDDSNDPLTPEAGAGSFPVDSRNFKVVSRGNSDNDVRHRGVVSFTYELPFGAGRTFWNHGVTGKALEGIQISGIVSAQTGHPYSIFTPLDNGRTGIASFSYPDVIGNPFQSSGSAITADGVRTGASNNDAFSQTFLGHVGDSGRNQFYGPNYVNADISLIKNMAITERFKLQIRSEFFNLLNHPQFNQPGAFVGTSSLGLSTSVLTRSDGTTSARQIQLALKLNF
jgi:hypothetical protein